MLHFTMFTDRLRYFIGVLLIIPVFPILFLQSKRIKRDFPDLPEATDPQGTTGNGPAMNVVFLGESSIAGVGVQTHEQGIAGHMARKLSQLKGKTIHWQVVAKSGYRAIRVRQKLVPKLPEEHIDLIVIGLGGNDTFQTNTPWGWKRDMNDLFESLRQEHPEAVLVLTYMPPVHTFVAFSSLMRFFLGNLTKLFGREMHRHCKGLEGIHYDNRVISLKDWIGRYPEANKPEDFFCDGVHPSGLTYMVWGEETASFIAESVLH